MDSETLGAIDNGDVSARERGRWGDKVYTRRNFRKKAKLGISNNDSATTTNSAADQPSVSTHPTADTKVSSSSPAKDDLAATGSVLRPPEEGTLDAQVGHSSDEQGQPLPSRSEGGPSTSDGVRPPPEDDSRGGEAVCSGGEGPTSLGVGTNRDVLEGGQKSIPNGEGEPPSGREREPLSQPLPNGGRHALPNGGEKQLSLVRDGPESSSELQHTGEPESLPGITQSQSPIILADARTTTAEREAAATAAQSNKELQVTVPMDEDSHARVEDRPVNGMVTAALANGLSKPMFARVDDTVRIDITGSRPRDEMRKLKRKLEDELEKVKSLGEKLQAKELQLTAYAMNGGNTNTRYVSGIGSYSQPQLSRAMSELGAGGHLFSGPHLTRVDSEVASVRYPDTRPFRHLSVSVAVNNHGVGESHEKEKRTPKANQFYNTTEFLLGKDRLPSESNRKLKLTKIGHNAEYGYGYGYHNRDKDKVFKNCSSLLQRLMKHKHGWVFNEPVDAKKLNIPDYHLIIKHPMDLGTIKSKLAQNFYKSAREFAEDVRLVFRNAMTYNPKGQDVHTMAEELSNIFEEKWIAIEKDLYPYQMYYDAGLPVSTPRKVPPPPPVYSYVPPPPVLTPVSVSSARSLERPDSMPVAVDSRPKPSISNLRTPAPKKPKAKDPNKRDMTYDEKQKLSTNLQSLPPEKLDAIVQIIKKRSTALSQHDDEIEVDIDSVDAETLWELDRFVTNYKKSLSKNKRKAELALKRRAEAAQAAQTTNPAPAVVEAQTENRTGNQINPLVVEVEKQGDNVSVSSSSSSSSSDSGSSSSDSDSDSSSADGSDGGHSPKS